MNAAALAAGAGVGVGVALFVRGAFPPRPSLADVLADLRRPRTPLATAATSSAATSAAAAATTTAATAAAATSSAAVDPAGDGWLARLGRPAGHRLAAAGLPRARVRADLALLDRPADVHLAEQAATAVIGLVLPAAVAGLLALAGGVHPSWVVPAWGCLALGALGFWTPDLLARADAAQRRREFVHALGAFLDLVVIGLAAGAGVDAALTHAADTGHGWAFDRIRHALTTAHLTRTSPWTALSDLGDTLAVPALREVAATVALAGTEGAKVRASLAAKASALRLREHATAEADAVAATERMSLPVIVMFAGFLVFIGYPAVVNVFAL